MSFLSDLLNNPLQALILFISFLKSSLSQDEVDLVDVALYNISADPEERVDLSKTYPDIVEKMQTRVNYYMKSSVKPLFEKADPEALETARKNGIWGPWRD